MQKTYAKVSVELKQESESSVSAQIEIEGAALDIIEAWHRAGHEIANQIGVPFSAICAVVLSSNDVLSDGVSEQITIDLSALKSGGTKNE